MASKEEHIDKIIRQKLSQLKVDQHPGSWEAFEQKLEQHEAAEDELLRHKMSQISPVFSADSWDRLSEQLSLSEAAEDELLRHKISQISPAFSASSWDRLSEQLNQSEALEDEIIRTKLSKIHPAYQEKSWQLLSSRIEQQNRRAQTILDYKFIELSLFLLLLFIFWQWGPLSDDMSPQQHFAPVPDQEQELSPEETNPIASPEADQTPIADLGPQDQTQITGLDGLDDSNNLLATDGTTYSPSSEQSTMNKRDEAIVFVPTLQLHSLDRLQDNNPFKGQQAQSLARLSYPESPTIAGLDIWPVSNGSDDEDLLLLESIVAATPKTSLRVGFVGSPDYNRVITPPYSVAGSDTTIAFDRYALGYSGGITLGIEHGRWEIEFGALYSERSYENIPVVALVGNFSEGYEGVGVKKNELNTLNLPLSFRYNFLLNRKWRVYGLMGGGLSTILHANYFVAGSSAYNLDELQFRGGSSNPGARGNARNDLPENLQKTPSGILQGGDFWNNTTIYLSGGFGLERYVSYRWSVFAQPTYQHSVFSPFNGIGPYQDKIHTMSILMGLKVKL